MTIDRIYSDIKKIFGIFCMIFACFCMCYISYGMILALEKEKTEIECKVTLQSLDNEPFNTTQFNDY